MFFVVFSSNILCNNNRHNDKHNDKHVDLDDDDIASILSKMDEDVDELQNDPISDSK